MQNTLAMSPKLSQATVISYAKTALHPYRCDWGGCDALLNCWMNLQKHYHWHCKNSKGKEDHHHSLCGIRFCTMNRNLALSATDMMLHITKTHLSKTHLPCPVSGCHSLMLPDQLYNHVNNVHFSRQSDNPHNQSKSPSLPLAKQASPFHPSPSTNTKESFPCDILPSYIVAPAVTVQPRTRHPRSSRHPPYKAKQHLTYWSCFVDEDKLDKKEEQSLQADLGFEPLHRPPTLPGKAWAPWPEFVVAIQPSTIPLTGQVSAPSYPTSFPIPQQGQANASNTKTFSYDAFKRYTEAKDVA
ncbi:hypothetical protein K439DRAFT_1121162 [Ramaria rubella]|nr:hypothetical protein K439DRAFT_1121162 [Ramaria rubella]